MSAPALPTLLLRYPGHAASRHIESLVWSRHSQRARDGFADLRTVVAIAITVAGGLLLAALLWWQLAGPAPMDTPAPIVVDPSVQQAIAEVSQKRQHLYARFEQDDAGRITAYLLSGEPHDAAATGRAVPLKTGYGIPLQETGCNVGFQQPPANRRKLVDQSSRQGDWKINRLRLLDAEGYDLTVSKVLWSPDGRYMFVMSNAGAVLQVDTDNWNVVFAHLPTVTNDFVRDIAITSAGLVILQNNSGYADAARDTAWVLAQPAKHVPGPHTVSLSLWDTETLHFRKSWLLMGNRITGSPNSPYLYVTHLDRLLVVDTVRGELVNGFLRSAATPKSEWQEATLASVDQGPEVDWNFFDVSPDGKWLMWLGDQVDQFRVQGPALHFQLRWSHTRVDTGATFKVSSDSQYLCVPDSNLGGGCVLRSLADPRKTVGTLGRFQYAGQFAINTSSKIGFVFCHGNEYRGPGDVQVVQDSGSTVVKLGADVKDLHPHPKKRGVFVEASGHCYWLEGGQPSRQWPFETKRAESIVGSAPESSSAEQPVEPIAAKDNVYPLAATWSAWTADGNAFVALDEAGILHRFDAQSQLETARIPVGSQSRGFMTADGPVLVSENDERLILLSHQDLSPIRTFTHLLQATGNVAHSLITAFQHGELVILDGPTGKVRDRAQAVQIHNLWPHWTGPGSTTAMAIFPDGLRVLVFQQDLRVLKFLDGALVVDYQFRRQPDLVRDFRLVVSPDSKAWALGPTIYRLAEQDSRSYLDAKVAFGPTGGFYTLDDGTLRVQDTEQVFGGILHEESLGSDVTDISVHPSDAKQLLVQKRGSLVVKALRLP